MKLRVVGSDLDKAEAYDLLKTLHVDEVNIVVTKPTEPTTSGFKLEVSDIFIYISVAAATLPVLKQLYEIIRHKDKAKMVLETEDGRRISVEKEMTIDEIERLCKKIE